MQKTNKEYFVKGSRWWWYSVFLIILNIVIPVSLETILGIIFIVEEIEELIFSFILMLPLIILLVILTTKFMKNTLKRDHGFSRSRLIFLSIVYVLYMIIAITGIAGIGEYCELTDFKAISIASPIGIGPVLLLANFLISYMYHKKGVIPADKKDKGLIILGIISIIASLIFPIIIIVIFCGLLLLKPSTKSYNKKIQCKNCGALIETNSKFCKNCGAVVGKSSKSSKKSGQEVSDNKEKNRCKNCNSLIEKDAIFCTNCGKEIN